MVHQKINHKFAFQQMSYDAEPNNQPYVKLLFFFSKMDGASDEQFHRHWETVHADLTIATEAFRVHNVQRYTQIHQTADMKEKVTTAHGSSSLLDFDGCSEIWVKSWDDWVNFAKSPEYASMLVPDCKYFMGATIKVFAGQENIIYGKKVDPQGKDGVVF